MNYFFAPIMISLIGAAATCSASYTLNLPESFCGSQEIVARPSGKNLGCIQQTLTLDTKNPVILVLIHGTFSNQDQFLEGITLTNSPIPTDFFKESIYNGTKPVRLSFNWSGENADTARLDGGKILAAGLNSLVQQCAAQGIEPKFIVVGHSHGGNVIAVASNLVKKPIECAIFLATPVLRHDQKIPRRTQLDYYLPRKIEQLFLFYSMTDFVQTAGSLANGMRRRYGPITGIDLYNVRFLIHGQEPSHVGLYTQVIEDNLLELCKKITTLYKKNKNLVTNIDLKNPQADKLIAIKAYDAKNNEQATDALWPNWEDFTYAPDELQENLTSQAMRTTFTDIYKKEFTDTAALLDRTVRAVQQDLCTNVIGNVGTGFFFMPEKIRRPAAKFCCTSEEFKNAHPNASAGLQCAKIPSAPGSLTDEENKDLCLNVIGQAGRTLYGLGKDSKNDLKKRCCSPEFKNKHPLASGALGC